MYQSLETALYPLALACTKQTVGLACIVRAQNNKYIRMLDNEELYKQIATC